MAINKKQETENKKIRRGRPPAPQKTGKKYYLDMPLKFWEEFSKYCRKNDTAMNDEFRKIVTMIVSGLWDIPALPKPSGPFNLTDINKASWQIFKRKCENAGLTAKDGLMVKVAESVDLYEKLGRGKSAFKKKIASKTKSTAAKKQVAEAETTTYFMRSAPPIFEEFKKIFYAGRGRWSTMSISKALRKIIDDVASGKDTIETKQAATIPKEPVKGKLLIFPESDWKIFTEQCEKTGIKPKEALILMGKQKIGLR